MPPPLPPVEIGLGMLYKIGLRKINLADTIVTFVNRRVWMSQRERDNQSV